GATGLGRRATCPDQTAEGRAALGIRGGRAPARPGPCALPGPGGEPRRVAVAYVPVAVAAPPAADAQFPTRRASFEPARSPLAVGGFRSAAIQVGSSV